jgi:hypothetical protein
LERGLRFHRGSQTTASSLTNFYADTQLFLATPSTPRTSLSGKKTELNSALRRLQGSS